MRRRVSFLDAVHWQSRLVRDVVCSQPWVETIVTPGEEPDEWFVDSEAYPPRGGAVSMAACVDCGRVAPVENPDGPLCCDCETEREELEFRHRVRAQDCECIAVGIVNRWWKQPPTYRDFLDWPSDAFAGFLGSETSVSDCDGDEVEELTELPNADEGFYEAESSPTADDRTVAEQPPRPWEVLQRVLRSLDPPKKGKGRASGCDVVLLPESDEALRREIDYCTANRGRVAPSATRVSKNPNFPRDEL